MKLPVYRGAEVQKQWDIIWSDDSLTRNQKKLDYPEYYALFERYIKPSDRILEAGVGLGKWLNYFHNKNYDIVGLDYSSEAVNKLLKHNPEYKVVTGDVTKMPLPDKSFDIYLSFGVLEHLENPADAYKSIEEAYRVLKPNGIAIISIPYLNALNFYSTAKNYLACNNLIRKAFGKPKITKHFFEYKYTISEFMKYIPEDKFTLLEHVPENIPLMLRDFKRYSIPKQEVKEIHDTNLNEKGLEKWKSLLSLPPTSFKRRQWSHLMFYVIQKK